MKAVKILMIVQSFYQNDPRVRREAETLIEVGYGVDIISLKDKNDPTQMELNNVHVYGISLNREYGNKLRYFYEYGFFLITATILALRLYLRNRYKIIQIHNLPDTLIFAALLPKILGAKIIFDAHEAMPEALRIKYGWSEKSFWNWSTVMIERFCMNMADYVFTIHEPMRQLFIRRGVISKNISVIMNWPDLKLFINIPSIKISNNKKRHFTLIYAGTVAKRYGLHTAIQGLPFLLKDIPNIRLRILGKGDYIEELKQLAMNLGVERFIIFEPPIPLMEIAKEYRMSDIGISPHCGDLFGDIYFSTKVAEYLTVGLPAIVSRTPIMNYYYNELLVEFFTPDNYIEFSDCVKKLYFNKKHRLDLIRRGLINVNKCTWNLEREKYLQEISKLLN